MLFRSENIRDLGWVLKMLQMSQINLDDAAMFTDRGKMVNTLEPLKIFFGISLNTKYCGEHIIPKVNTAFKVGKDEQCIVRNCVNSLQSADNADKYFSILANP